MRTLLVLLAATHVANAVVYTGSKSLAPWYNISWVSDTATERIELTVEARTTGWVGFGLAEAGGMRGADIFMVSVQRVWRPRATTTRSPKKRRRMT